MSDDILAKYPGMAGRPGEMAMLCAFLRNRGLHADALAMGEAAVAAAPDSLAIATEVRGVLSKGVQDFHRSMLLDRTRNRAYARAIERMVRPGMNVLEIGTGGGLLAMLAARAGARVVTCEGNPMIAAAAREIIRRNGLSDRINVVAKLSTELRIPEDLPEPADLVIHEIFGAQLFDEGVTESLKDARERLLKPGAPSLPPGASLRCALLRQRREPKARDFSDIEGFDMSAFEFLTSQRRWLNEARLNDFDIRSEPRSGLHMNYDSPPPFGPASETVTLTSQGGRIDAIVQWIEIDLGGERLENNHWRADGASSWGAPVLRLREPIHTNPGDLIDVTFRHRQMLLVADVAARTKPPAQA